MSLDGIIRCLLNLQALTDDSVSLSACMDENNNRSYNVNLIKASTVNKSTGTNLLRRIVGNKNKLTLDYENSRNIKTPTNIMNFTKFDVPNGVTEGSPSGNNAYVSISDRYDPMIEIYSQDYSTQMSTRPSYIGLGHELIHGLHILEGFFTPCDIMGINPFSNVAEPFEEMFTIGITGDEEFTENKLRKENGLPERATFTM